MVSATLGHDGLAEMHAVWHDLLGPAELNEVDDDVLAWAIHAVRNGPTAMETELLPAEVSPRARRALVALVVHGTVVAQTLQAGSSLSERLRGRVAGSPLDALGDLAVLAAGLPVAAPTVVAGALAGVVGRVVPAPPVVRLVDEPNLLAQLLAETLPVWFGGVVGRTLVANLPVTVPVAVRAGRSGATVRLGRGELTIHNGVAVDAWALFDGDIDGLLRAGTGALSREVRAAGLHR